MSLTDKFFSGCLIVAAGGILFLVGSLFYAATKGDVFRKPPRYKDINKDGTADLVISVIDKEVGILKLQTFKDEVLYGKEIDGQIFYFREK